MRILSSIYWLLVSFLISTHCFAQWEVVYELVDEMYSIHEFRGLSFVNESTGYSIINGVEMVGEVALPVSRILKTEDYAISWDTVYTRHYAVQEGLLIGALEDVFFLNDSIGWVCGQNMGYILKTTDAGETWNEYPIALEDLTQIEFLDENYGVVASWIGDGAETFDGGETWHITSELIAYDVCLIDECNFLSVYSGAYQHRLECGTTYFEFPTVNDSPVQRFGRAVHVWDDQTFIFGAGGIVGFNNFTSILKTEDGGETYSILDFPFGSGTGHFEFINDSVGFISTYSSSNIYHSAYKTIDGGNTWYGQITPFDPLGRYYGLGDIRCLNDSVCYARQGKVILRTLTGGSELQTAWTGIETIPFHLATEFNAYPNPTNSALTIERVGVRNEAVELEISDAVGKLVLSSRMDAAQSKLELHLSQLESGMYLVKLMSKDQIEVKRIIKE